MSTKNILIVVDVQNCFMKNIFGSDANENFLNQTDENNCIEMVQQISELTKVNDLVVLTRDLHPLNHISFGEGSEGRLINPPITWPIHCRNPTQKCTSRTNNTEEPNRPKFEKKFSDLIDPIPKVPVTDLNILPQGDADSNLHRYKEKLTEFITKNSLSSKPIIGNELSYFFYGTEIGQDILNLNNSNKYGVNKIGMNRSQFENQDNTFDPNYKLKDTNTIADIRFADVKPNGKFITLTKGERCDQESYSAFNYHIDYKIDKPSNPEINYEFNSVDEKQSTGLWEWILLNKGDATNINITVCGLVGNVCVMHTVLQGKAMWDTLYKNKYPDITITVDFCFSLIGTLFLETLPPGKDNVIVEKNEESIINQKINVPGVGEKSLKEWMQFNYPSTSLVSFEKAFPNFESLTLFTPFEERGKQPGGKKSNRCPKCKKNHIQGGKCFVCGFIPFLGKTQKEKRGKGKKTRKNKRRFSRKLRR